MSVVVGELFLIVGSFEFTYQVVKCYNLKKKKTLHMSFSWKEMVES